MNKNSPREDKLSKKNISEDGAIKKLFYRNPKKSPVKKMLASIFQPIIAILIGLFIGGIIIAFSGANVGEVYKTMFKGGFGTGYYLLSTLMRAVPIMLCGVGALFAWRAGYINIGGEGQLVLGGFFAAVTSLYLPFRGGIGILTTIVISSCIGGLYALLTAFLQEEFSVPILISTLMFNYIADNVTHYFSAYPLRDRSLDGLAAKTHTIDKSLWLPRISMIKGSKFGLGFFIALAAALAVYLIIKKTRFGYESKMTGLNADFARYGGVKNKKVMYITMFVSGALCALGGSLVVLGETHNYIHGMLKSPSYAWSGLMAALIAGLNPLGTIICSIFLAGLQTGGSAIERSGLGVPLEITLIIQAVITLLVSAKLLVKLAAHFREKRLEKSIQKSGGTVQ